MSTEDETFDIDLYGDEQDDEEVEQYHGQDDTDNNRKESSETVYDSEAQEVKQTSATAIEQPQPSATNTTTSNVTATAPTPISQGVKRKASDNEEHTESGTHDERPLDQGAQISLKLTELQWWTTEEDLRYFCVQSNTEAELVGVAFGEHKQNGKSKGEAYLEFTSPQAAGMAKRQIEKANAELDADDKSNVVGKSKISVWYTAPGNPFKIREGQSKKEVGGKYGQQGAYNNYNRGGFAGGRGRGGYNARGGGQWSNQNANGASNYNNGMMGGFGNMMGFPAMGMNQNALMNNMMAGAGFNMAAMGMGMPGMMNARGGANMMNRGGWNSGMGQGYQQATSHGSTGWDSNKKARKD